MAKYNIYTKVDTNTAPENLFYEIELYRLNGDTKYYALPPTGMQPLQTGNLTKKHETLDIPDKEETSFILSVMLYRKVGAQYIKILKEPATSIAPLKGFTSIDSFLGKSRNNACHFETVQQTQKTKQGEIHTYNLKISCQERIFIAKEHPISDPLDPFTKEKIENELRIRMTKPVPTRYSNLTEHLEAVRVRYYPNQAASMFCGAASFFIACKKIDQTYTNR